MKKAKFIIPLAAAVLLAGCAGGGEDSSVTSSSSSSSSSSSNSASSSSSSSSDASSSTITKKAITISELKTQSEGYSSNTSKIAGGSVTRSEKSDYTDDNYVDYYEYSADGKAAHIKKQSYDESYTDIYLVPSGEEIVPVEKADDGSLSRYNDGYNEASYHFNYYLGSGSSYGAEGFLDDLVKKGERNPNGDFSAYEEAGKTYFSYGYYEGSDPWEYYIVEVSMPSYVSSSGLEKLDVKMTEYSSMSFIFDDELGKITLLPNASINSVKTYSITQTVATRTYTNSIDLSVFAYTSFDLEKVDIDDDGNETRTDVAENETFTVQNGDTLEFELKNILPATANSSFDPISVTYTGGEVGDIDWSFWNNTISIFTYNVGTYEVSIASEKVAKHIKVVVTAPLPKSISSVTYYTRMPGGFESDYVEENESSFSVYTGVTYYLKPSVSPYNADQGVTATASSSSSDNSYSFEKTSVKISSWDDEDTEVYAFTANEAGSYSVTFSSTADSSITRTVTIDALTTSVKDTLSRKHAIRDSYGSGPVKYEFSFDPTDDDSGSLIVTNKIDNKSETASYTLGEKTLLGRTFNFSHVSGDEFIASDFDTIVFGDNYKLYTKFEQDDYSYTEIREASPSFYATQKWQGSSGDYTFSFNLYENGTVSGNLKKGDEFDGYLSCAWNIGSDSNTDGSYTIVFSETGGDYDDYGPFASFPASVTLSKEMDTITAVTNVGTFTMKYAASSRAD